MKSASLSILSFILDFVQILADLSACATFFVAHLVTCTQWAKSSSRQSQWKGFP